VFGAGQPAFRNRIPGVEIGPVGGDVEAAGLGGDQGVFVGLRGSQGLRGIQLHQTVIFEHVFNIEERADTLRLFNAPRASDNTTPIRTTLRWQAPTVGAWGRLGMRG
jgi:hypothetical protein